MKATGRIAAVAAVAAIAVVSVAVIAPIYGGWGPLYLCAAGTSADGGRTIAVSASAPRVPGFADIKDAEPNFDGSSIVFAGKQTPSGPWQIWEMRPNGRGLTQRVQTTTDCTEPHYLSDGRIVFVQTSNAPPIPQPLSPSEGRKGSTLGGGKAFSSGFLSTVDADGKVERITFNADPIGNTTVLPDGRIAATLGSSLVTVNVDGTGIARYVGDPAYVADARTAALTAPRPKPTGHVSVIDKKKRLDSLLFCANVYQSDVPGLCSLPDGAVAKMRVWARDPQPHVVAETPVESDGSFLWEAPADTPLRFQTLDASGKVLGDQKTWIWTRANESRGCIGCHESASLTPANQVALATRKPPFLLPGAQPPTPSPASSPAQGAKP